MDPSKIFVYFGYAMSGVFLVLGVYVLFFFPEEIHLPGKFRVMFGVVLLLYSVYRFISLRIKQRQADEEHQFE
ncbi:MAG: hypothetical protein WCW40_07475 [Bacteroidota bacterium]